MGREVGGISAVGDVVLISGLPVMLARPGFLGSHVQSRRSSLREGEIILPQRFVYSHAVCLTAMSVS